MKTISIILALLSIVLVENKEIINNQIVQKATIEGVFDGYDEEDGYSFLVIDKETESENVMYFNDVTEDVLKEFNLQSTNFLGKKFEITYEIEEMEDEEDGEIYEKFIIIKLVKK